MAHVVMQGAKQSKAPVDGYKTIVYIICAVAALGGLLFGLDQGFIANSLGTIEKVYNLDIARGEAYAAILATGGILGALLSGIFARLLGRKRSLVFAGFLFSAASIASALLPAFSILMFCRFALGFAVGVASFVVPLYLSETAPASIRGAMGTLFQLMITIGIFLISLSNFFIVKLITVETKALSVMFLVVAAFSLLMFFASFILPESPRWLILKGKKKEAEANLMRTLGIESEVKAEISEIEQAIASDKGTGLSMLFEGYFLKIILVGALLQMFQQFVGINVMIYYSPKIFEYAGITGFVAMMIVPTVNMLFTFPAIKLVERWGRKKLLYVGAVCMFVSMVTAGFCFLTIANDAKHIASLTQILLLASSVVYIFGFAVSWGPVAWLLCSEIFPLESREVGMTITTMVNWTFAGLLMRFSLSFMEMYGNASIFFLFACFCVFAIIFVKFFIPETKGVTLEHIELNLKKGVRMRDLGKI